LLLRERWAADTAFDLSTNGSRLAAPGIAMIHADSDDRCGASTCRRAPFRRGRTGASLTIDVS